MSGPRGPGRVNPVLAARRVPISGQTAPEAFRPWHQRARHLPSRTPNLTTRYAAGRVSPHETIWAERSATARRQGSRGPKSLWGYPEQGDPTLGREARADSPRSPSRSGPSAPASGARHFVSSAVGSSDGGSRCLLRRQFDPPERGPRRPALDTTGKDRLQLHGARDHRPGTIGLLGADAHCAGGVSSSPGSTALRRRLHQASHPVSIRAAEPASDEHGRAASRERVRRPAFPLVAGVRRHGADHRQALSTSSVCSAGRHCPGSPRATS